MTNPLEDFSWFQKTIFIYIAAVSFFSGLGYNSIDSSFGYAIGLCFATSAFTFLFMRMYNKYLAPKIKTQNKALKIIWKTFQFIVVAFIVLWCLLVIYEFAKASGW